MQNCTLTHCLASSCNKVLVLLCLICAVYGLASDNFDQCRRLCKLNYPQQEHQCLATRCTRVLEAEISKLMDTIQMEESMAPFPDHAPDYVPAYADYLSQSRGDSPLSNGPVYSQEQPIWVNRRSGDSRSNKRKPADMAFRKYLQSSRSRVSRLH